MVVETMAGTSAWLAEHGYDGAELRRRVATPGGATERGLVALEQGGLEKLARAAVDAVVEGTR
jgi:pyrroline-5-carboxylate reductase